jgi:branched-chain amino acid transport system ATP-binding protein
MTAVLLSLDDITTYYGQMRILEGISLQVGAGELVCLLGGNASGKSTTLKTILGIVRPRAGEVLLDGQDVTSWPVPQRIARGMAIVPENRRLFGQLTVLENLELGAVLRAARSSARTSTGSTGCSRACTSGAASSRARCPAASSRWSRWAAR